MKTYAVIHLNPEKITVGQKKELGLVVNLLASVQRGTPEDLEAMFDASNNKDGKLGLDIMKDNGEGGYLPAVSVGVSLVGNVTTDRKTKETSFKLGMLHDDLKDCGLVTDDLWDADLRLECKVSDQQTLEEAAAGLEQEAPAQVAPPVELAGPGEEGTVESDPESEISGTTEEIEPEAESENTDQDSTPPTEPTPENEPAAETAPAQEAAPALPAKPARGGRITSKGAEA